MSSSGAGAGFAPTGSGNGPSSVNVTSPAVVSRSEQLTSKSTSKPWHPNSLVDRAAAKFYSDPAIRKEAY